MASGGLAPLSTSAGATVLAMAMAVRGAGLTALSGAGLSSLVLLCEQRHHHHRSHDLQHHDSRLLTQAGWGSDPP